ncbi:hypothetical protein [Piscirickettsia salmonis]|uniref:hypothetical protein n=1 Tax=Piscirickettsia salmonis TaxID=1238 RepID=UPI0012B73090|nr:hypothetical protein [Piscirickettsia salmonis]
MLTEDSSYELSHFKGGLPALSQDYLGGWIFDPSRRLGISEDPWRFNLQQIELAVANIKLNHPRKRRYLGRYFAHPMMQNRRAKRDDYKPSAVRVTQRCVP